jgi:hypothetical protein
MSRKKNYPELLDKIRFGLIEIDDVTDFVITPLVPNMKISCQQHEPEFLKYLNNTQIKDCLQLSQNRRDMEYIEDETINYLIQMLPDLSDYLEYAWVTAQKRA